MESHIAYPTDSQLLSDPIRVLTRTLRRLARRHKIVFHDHQLRAKRRCMNIRNHRGARRRRAYRDLLKVARKTAHYTRMALQQAHLWTDPRNQVRAGKLRYYLDLMTRIIDQTERRVLHGESVPAQEKVLSLFGRIRNSASVSFCLLGFSQNSRLVPFGTHQWAVVKPFVIRSWVFCEGCTGRIGSLI